MVSDCLSEWFLFGMRGNLQVVISQSATRHHAACVYTLGWFQDKNDKCGPLEIHFECNNAAWLLMEPLGTLVIHFCDTTLRKKYVSILLLRCHQRCISPVLGRQSVTKVWAEHFNFGVDHRTSNIHSKKCQTGCSIEWYVNIFQGLERSHCLTLSLWERPRVNLPALAFIPSPAVPLPPQPPVCSAEVLSEAAHISKHAPGK